LGRKRVQFTAIKSWVVNVFNSLRLIRIFAWTG